MVLEQIVPQSAGSLSVAVLALLMTVIQFWLVLRKPQFRWFAWAAAGSFSGMVYAVGIFLEYNMPAGPINWFGGVLEFSALILLVHCLYGLTFDYLKIDGKLYHLIAGAFHAVILVILWSSNVFVADEFIARDFTGLAKPFIEAALGPLGPFFIVYVLGACLGAVSLWFRHRPPDRRYKAAYLSGIVFWIVLGFHDALAALGVTTVQYVMEYGFIGLSAVVLWIVFNNYTDVLAEDKYRVITEFSNDGILIIQGGKVIFENPACSHLFGNPVLDFGIEALAQDIVPEDRKKLTCLNEILNSTGEGTLLTARMKKPESSVRHLEVRANMISYRNRRAVLVVIRDITEHILEEAAIKDREEKLARLRKMESIGLLAGGVAHDLNNVLSGIVSYPDLMLLDLPEESEFRKPLETIQESGMRAAAIVHDLLTIARGAAIQKEPFDLNQVIQSYLAAPECKSPGVEIRTNLDPGLMNIKGSPAHFRKMVMNLLSNAFEAGDGGGTVVVSTANRHLDRPLKGYDIVNAGEYAVIIVEDDGPGISSEDINRIFEPFYTKKIMGRSGTGLGLTVVWNVVQDHDGYINVTSSPRGSRFELYFPVTREPVADGRKSSPLESMKGSGEKILVVDDVEIQREVSCRMLEKLGYSPATVGSGEEAVEYVRGRKVDLLMLDMIMDPGIDGRETFERILKISPDQKAIIVSGYAETDQVREAMKLGAACYLKKPLMLEELGLAVKRVLGNGQPD